MSDNETTRALLRNELTGARIVGFAYEPAMFVLRLEAKRGILEVDMIAPWCYSGELAYGEDADRDAQRRVDAARASRLVKSVDCIVQSASIENDGGLRIGFDDGSILLISGISKVFDTSWMIRMPPSQGDRRSIVCDSEGSIFANWP